MNKEKIKNYCLDLFFPKFCLGCGREGSFLCEDCKETLDINQFNYCLCDKNPFRLPPDQKQGKCPRCQDKKLSGLYFALPYKDKALTKKLIYQFKYPPYLKNLAKTFAYLITEHLFLSGKNKDEVWQDSVLVPVPLYKNKFNERGYNQSEELANELSKILKIPVVSNCLLKIKPTKPQMELSKADRETNLLGSFVIKNLVTSDVAKFNSRASHDIARLFGKKVFLIDDVYTTGSTMHECAKVLKQAGAKSVWGICIARDG